MRRTTLVLAHAVGLALGVGAVLHALHDGHHEVAELPPVLHWLRDSFMGVPAALVAIVVGGIVARRLVTPATTRSVRELRRVVSALVGGTVYALASVPGGRIHAALFEGGESEGLGAVHHALVDGSAVLVSAVAFLLLVHLVHGTPFERRSPVGRAVGRARRNGVRPTVAPVATAVIGRPRLVSLAVAVAAASAVAVGAGAVVGAAESAPSVSCTSLGGTRTIVADVVALDQEIVYNRLGARNESGMVYALRSDVVAKDPSQPLGPGNAILRTGKRPRPITLRVDVGDCLRIHFENLLSPTALSDQPGDRHASIHVNGMQLADPDGAGPLSPIDSDGSYVGRNASSLVAPGESRDYLLLAEYENTYLMYSMGASTGAEGNGGSLSFGLFGAVDVEPYGTEWYRSQLSRAELDLATPGERYTDTNGNGRYDRATVGETLVPTSLICPEGVLDEASGSCFVDANGNGTPDAATPGEPTTPPTWSCGEGETLTADAGDCFVDDNANGALDAGETESAPPVGTCPTGDVLRPEIDDEAATCFTDLDGDEAYDGPTADEVRGAQVPGCADGELGPVTVGGSLTCFVDEGDAATANEEYDAPSTAEPFVDVDGDGRWDAHATTPDGHPLLDYDAVYPTDLEKLERAGIDASLAGLPILRMLDDDGRIVHSDLNAIIAGGPENDYRIPHRAYPDSYRANAVYDQGSDRGSEPFREFTVIFHDEVQAEQAFPEFYDDAKLAHTLSGVGDGFGINYGIAGVGSEVIANRLGVGPMWNCNDCKFEEFFLSSWSVGDPAMIVDRPANQTAALGGPGSTDPLARATKALYPDDPSNVHHSYLGDRVKFRNLHAGPKEHHIFHLHAHQWEYDWNSEKSSYLDSQNIGPGGGFTYEIAYGGSGNRNKTFGDSIFHCHFYPHFGQGMWELWRTHDTFEAGTVLDDDGRPVEGSRALPDGEITAGTPIPAVVPLPGRPMAPISKAPAAVVPYDLNGDGTMDSGQLDVDGNGVADLDEQFSARTTLTTAAAAGATDVVVDDTAGMEEGQTLVLGTGAGAERKEIASVGSAGLVTLTSGLDAAKPAGSDAVRGDNPGYPFFVPAVAGHRPPTAPLDVKVDGGLRRHVIVGGTSEHFETRLDLSKTLETAKVAYLPEDGSAAEKAAMAYHGQWWHPTFTPAGTRVSTSAPLASGGRGLGGFETNGLPGVAGAPFANPCRSEPSASNGWAAPRLVGTPRHYAAAAIQLDLTLNKAGWHFPQQRLLSLNEDVGPTLTKTRPAQPLVMRLGVGDCADFDHTNLIPNTYELDDFQVRTPTDVIGQHIHLVKFDVLSADGSGNGFNYEDGTLSPQEVEERIHAVRAGNGCPTDPGQPGRLDAGETPTDECPLARKHPVFGATAGVGDLAWGARTTVQRWYADALLNHAWDNGLGSVFTHDHFGPSTHQQTGLYATVLVEPEGSIWTDPETGVRLGSTARSDGGPTSWQANITWPAGDARNVNAHREFYLEISDFQHAYLKGAATAPRLQDNEAGRQIPSYADFQNAVNPSYRQESVSGHESSLFFFPPWCPNTPGGDAHGPGGPTQVNDTPRPCPEAISADDPGTYVVNYRNEPVGLRVYDPRTKAQATGQKGDLGLAYQSRTDRAVTELNRQPAGPSLTRDVQPGDPYTPLLRAYQGDRVRIRVQVGAHEEEHTFSVAGLKWLSEPMNPSSGWRDSQAMGISEYFTAEAPVVPDLSTGRSVRSVDYPYEIGAATEDVWNGNWGLLRAYGERRTDLLTLPNNALPAGGWRISNQWAFDHACPRVVNGVRTRVRAYELSAVRALDVLGPDGIVYNGRLAGRKLTDPTALLYVETRDLMRDPSTGKLMLRPGTPIEPIVLRAAAGECIKVTLENRLPSTLYAAGQNLPGYNGLPPIVQKEKVDVGSPFGPGIVTFNANDLTPSNRIGLNPQLVAADQRRDSGVVAGSREADALVAPGDRRTYTWYAGHLDLVPDPKDPANARLLAATPVEFGAVNLRAADRILGASKGLIGSLVVEPPGATWRTDPGTRASATVTFPVPGGGTTSTREFVTVLQDDVSLHYRGGDCTPSVVNLQCAVGNVHSEGAGSPEDPQDSGQKAINYRTDPLWYRLGIAPETDFTSSTLRDSTDVSRVYSNDLVGGDPNTVIFQSSTAAGTPDAVRIRTVEPGGHGRGHEITVHGHAWQRAPYVTTGALASDRLAWRSASDPTDLSGPVPAGENRESWWISSQESISAGSHFDFQLQKRGGEFGAEGDFLFRDYASFGAYQGLWGLLRVGRSPGLAERDAYFVKGGTTLTVGSASGLLVNDLDLDGDGVAVDTAGGRPVRQQFATDKGGKATVNPDGSFSYTPPLLFTGVDTFAYALAGGRSAPVALIVRSAAPVAVSDYAAVGVNPTVGQVVTIPVLANDTDADGVQTLTLVNDPATGIVKISRASGARSSATIAGDATGRGLVYAPVTPVVVGDDMFAYEVADGTGNTTPGYARVTVVNADVGALTLSRVEWNRTTGAWTIEGTVAGPTATRWPSAVVLRVGARTIATVALTAPVAGVDEPAPQPVVFTGRGSAVPFTCGEKVTVESRFGTASGARIQNVPLTCTR